MKVGYLIILVISSIMRLGESTSHYEIAEMALDSGNYISQLIFRDNIEIYMEPNSQEIQKQFHGRAYRDIRSDTIVCSLGGTKSIRDILVDDRQVYRKQIPDKYYEGINFYQRVKDKMQMDGISINKLIISGHSLGGLIAEMICMNKNIQCIVFESPGARDALK